jgi:hypothetical protein
MAGFEPAPMNAGNALTLSSDVNVDPVEWLTEQAPQAAARLQALKDRADLLHKTLPTWDVRSLAAEKKTEAVQRLARLRARRTEIAGTGFGFDLPPDDPQVVAQEKLVRRASREVDRIAGIYEQKVGEWSAASRTVVACNSYLKSGKPGGTVLIDYTGDPPKLRNDQSLPDEISRFRKKIAELQAEIADIENRPLPSAYCRKKAKAYIETLSARGKLDVRALVAGGLDVQFASERHSHNISGFDVAGKPVAGVVSWQAPDLIGLFAHVHKQALLSAVDAAITAECVDDAKALTPEAKDRTLADLRVKLLQAERDDCALTHQAIFEQKLGQIEFRGDADPRAVLNIELLVAPAKAAVTAPGTHSFEIVG